MLGDMFSKLSFEVGTIFKMGTGVEFNKKVYLR